MFWPFSSIKTVLSTAFLFVAVCTHAQLHPADFTQYTLRNGLSSNQLTGIAQDERGYLWISSVNGLNRYDGKQFTQFHAGSESNSLPDDHITSITWLKPGKLAACTNMGLHITDTRTGKTSTVIIPGFEQKLTYRYNEIFSVTGDEEGNMFILTTSGFYHYNKNNELVNRYDYMEKEKVVSTIFSYSRTLIWLNKKRLYFVLDGLEKYIYDIPAKKVTKAKGIAPFDFYVEELAESWQTEPGSFFMFKLMSDSMIYFNTVKNTRTVSLSDVKPLRSYFNWQAAVYRLSDTLFYIAGRQNGFYKMSVDLQTGKLTIHPEQYFKDYYCTGFLKDREGRLWIATRSGLFKQNIIRSNVQQVSIPEEILQQAPNTEIRNLLLYKDKLYAACTNNGGLLVFDKDSLRFIKKISLAKMHPHADDTRSVMQVSGDTFFIGTYGPMYKLNIATEQSTVIEPEGWNKFSDFSLAQLKDKEGNIWISTSKKKIYFYKASEGKFYLINYKNTVFENLLLPIHIARDQEGNIWFGGHGVCRVNAQTKQPDLYLDSFPGFRFSRKETGGLTVDKNDLLWFGNKANGLMAYNRQTKNYLHFTKEDGLAGNTVVALNAVHNHVWAGTTEGISSVNLNDNKISTYGVNDGFPTAQLSARNLVYDSSNQSIYGGFTDRIVKFSPYNLLEPLKAPEMFIESVEIPNDILYYLPATSVTTNHINNDLKISIGVISFNEDASNQMLSYRLSNSNDTAWKNLNGRVIQFNNLAHGSYTLQLRLSAANNRWSQQVISFTINVKPPFWKTGWFISILSALILFIGYLLYRWRIFYIRKVESEKARMQELRAEKYKTQFELEQISNYFSLSLTDKKTTDDVLWDVAKNLIGRMGCEDCMIYLWNKDKTKMQQRAGYGNKNSPEKLAEHLFEVEMGQGVVGYVMQTKEPVIIADTRTDKRYRVDDMQRLSEICVPIIHEGELMGIIDSENSKLNHFKERDLQIMTTIATLTGNKIKQVESEQVLNVKKKELATINEHLAEAQLSALQAQMNPHFVFNALNSIKRLILDDEKDKASRYLSKFAQLIRLTLNHSRETFVTLRENVEYLHAYLEMEQLRFKDSFNATVKVDAAIDDEEIVVPSLMIQPLVENAVWHGLLHNQGKKKITVRFSANGPYIICSIEDNGIGIRRSEANKNLQHAAHKSVGLDNLRNRIAIMNEKFDMDCSLTISDLSETDAALSGTLAVLKFKNRDLV